jgi:hypothetical protein
VQHPPPTPTPKRIRLPCLANMLHTAARCCGPPGGNLRVPARLPNWLFARAAHTRRVQKLKQRTVSQLLVIQTQLSGGSISGMIRGHFIYEGILYTGRNVCEKKLSIPRYAMCYLT